MGKKIFDIFVKWINNIKNMVLSEKFINVILKKLIVKINNFLFVDLYVSLMDSYGIKFEKWYLF